MPNAEIPAGSAPCLGNPGACDCNFWVVSSRCCRNTGSAPCDAGGCLSFFHVSAEGKLHPARRETFQAALSPDRPVCFVVHGSYNWWRDVVHESRKINQWIRSAAPHLPVNVVIFTWPSEGYMPYILPVDLALLGRRSSYHGLYLATLVSLVPPETPVSIVGHSHGARTAASALHLLGGGAVEGGQALQPGWSTPPRLRAVLIAAAIDHHWLNPGQRYGQALLAPERVLVMRNSRDATLAIYPMRKPFAQRSLGKNGLGWNDRLALNGLGPKVVELDAAQFTRWNHSFEDYHTSAELASAMIPYVYFQEDALSAGALPTGTRPTGPLPAGTVEGVHSDPQPSSGNVSPTPTSNRAQSDVGQPGAGQPGAGQPGVSQHIPVRSNGVRATPGQRLSPPEKREKPSLGPNLPKLTPASRPIWRWKPREDLPRPTAPRGNPVDLQLED